MKLPAKSTILFQGDSITDGNRTRDNDPNHWLGHGYAQMVAARIGFEQPERDYRFLNRGISGNTVAELGRRWETDCIDLKPDMLSILAGINDVNALADGRRDRELLEPEIQYRALIDRALVANPGLVLVLMEPFCARLGRLFPHFSLWEEQTARRQTIVQGLAKEYGAIFVPLQKRFDRVLQKPRPDYWLWDGIHPTVAGHELIARAWLEEASGYF